MTLVEQLTRDEGFRPKPYADTTGHLTIGYGRNLSTVGITEAEARVLLDHDISTASAGVLSRIPWALRLDEVRRAALTNLAFNLGIVGLLKFTSMLTAMECEDWRKAARELLNSKAATQAPNRYGRLADQLVSGEMR